MSQSSIKHLNDEQFFKLYIESADTIFNNGSQEKVFIKSKELVMCYISKEYERVYSSDELKYPTGEHFSPEDREKYLKEVEDARVQDQQIKTSLQPKRYIFIDQYKHISYVYKRPIINPYTGNFIGIIGLVSHFAIPNILKLIYQINDIKHGLVNQVHKSPPEYILNDRQHIVLFLYLNKCSNSEISEVITNLGFKLSTSRVNDHLENLKFIFHVKTKDQLIEKAIAMNYHVFIPRQILKSGSFEINDEIMILE